jgi:CO/xanthine dehydrogenase Mo-binding subunit
MPVASVGDSAVTTIEAIGETPIGQSLQKAWLDLEVVQCGYCQSGKKLEAIYQVPFLAHTTMEPVNCTVDVREDACEIWVGIQVMSRARAVAAELTDLPPEKITVHNHMLGGGFGRRLEVDFIAMAVEIAKQVEGPVKLIWSREEDVQHDMYRPYFYDRLHAGLDSDGMPVAWSHRICGASVVALLRDVRPQGRLRFRHRRWCEGAALLNPERSRRICTS